MPPPAALSSARTTVVPTAITRAPRTRAAATAGTGVGTDLDEFGVHDMGAHRIGAHRLKGTGTHVQRDEGAVHAARLQVREQLGIEMQAGGRRRHRALLAREHALVARDVAEVGVATDVGRQRHLPVPLEEAERRIGQLHHPQIATPLDHADRTAAALQ